MAVTDDVVWWKMGSMMRNVYDGESRVVFVGNIGRFSFKGRINLGGVPEGVDIGFGSISV